MRRALLSLLTFIAASAQAQDATQAEAAAMREAWAATDQPKINVVQPVYHRTIAFDLPRAYVLAFRQTDPRGFYIAEYLPDGETLESWTRMITLTSTRDMGGAKVDDAALAAVMFNRPKCTGWIYHDLGAAPTKTSATQRTLVIGCDAVGAKDYAEAQAGASERAAIAFIRDGKDVWTVQIAERNLAGKAQALFDVARAPDMLAALGILACAPDDPSSDCQEVIAAAKGAP